MASLLARLNRQVHAHAPAEVASKLQVGEEFTASAHQQQMQLEALQTLAVALGRTDLAATQAVAGLQLRLYHPEMAACTMEDDPAGNATMQVQHALLFDCAASGDCSV